MSATSVVGSARKPFYSTLTFQLVVGLATMATSYWQKERVGFQARLPEAAVRKPV